MATAENGAPKTELQELQMKSNQVTDEVSITPYYRYLFVFGVVPCLVPCSYCFFELGVLFLGKRWVPVFLSIKLFVQIRKKNSSLLSLVPYVERSLKTVRYVTVVNKS